MAGLTLSLRSPGPLPPRPSSLSLSRRARPDLAYRLSPRPSKRQRPPSNLKYAFTALPTFPSTHAALASLSHAPHAVQLWTPTVDPPLAAHGQRAFWTTKSPCTVLFRPRPGHDTGGSPWVRGLSGADCLSGPRKHMLIPFRAYNCCRHIFHMKNISTTRARASGNLNRRLMRWYLGGQIHPLPMRLAGRNPQKQAGLTGLVDSTLFIGLLDYVLSWYII